jgi:beta-glucosidase
VSGNKITAITTNRRSALGWLGSASVAALTSTLTPRLARAAAAPMVYKDARAPIDLRVRDLMSRMTLDEKVAQLVTLSTSKRQVMDAALRFDPTRATGR